MAYRLAPSIASLNLCQEKHLELESRVILKTREYRLKLEVSCSTKNETSTESRMSKLLQIIGVQIRKHFKN
uniref:Uncharacterized protein n=1 Tax=Rhizophora mucronata TaxID=61149 RepID=A0A2P2NKZ9_RHIMU